MPPSTLSPILTGFNDDELVTFFKEHEASVPYLYRDSEGYPTVGVGHLVANVESAAKIPFRYGYPWQPGRPATQDEIKRGYEFLPPQSNPPRTHERYNPTENNVVPLYLSEQDQATLLKQDIREHAERVTQKFELFDTLPKAARQALLDMQFNMGGRFTEKRWPKLFNAVQKRDWETAAHESYRYQIGKNRNESVKTLFLQSLNDETD